MSVNSAEINLRVTAELAGGADLGGAPLYRPELEALHQFESGTTANKLDIVFADERSVGAGANDDIDLNGVLEDAFGAAIASVEVVFFAIKNKSTTQTLTVGGSPTNPWITWLIATGDGIKIPPSGSMHLAAPDASGLGAVVAGASDILRITNSAGSAALYEIMIGARTA